jgi:hypothetical protein
VTDTGYHGENTHLFEEKNGKITAKKLLLKTLF